MFEFDLRFVKLKNKLTGFAMRLKTRIKSFKIDFNIRIARVQKLPVCSYKRYTTLRNPSDVDMVRYFRAFSDTLCD